MSRLGLGIGGGTRRKHWGFGLMSGRGGIPAWVSAGAVYDYDFFNSRYWPAPVASELTDVRADQKFGQSTAGTLQLFAPNVLAITDTLSVEAAASQKATFTQAFDNAAWTKTFTTITADATAAPDGTTTADLVTANNTANQHYVQEFLAITAVPYELSVYAKVSTAAFIHLAVTGANIYAQFNLSTGALVFSSAGTGTLTSTSATQIGNGWWRFAMVFTQSSGSTQNCRIYTLAASQNVASPSETSTAALYLWGANLKTTGFGTSYILGVDGTTPTTRAADAITANRIGVTRVVFTFDDNSTQTVSGLPAGTPYVISTSLNRPLIKHMIGYASAIVFALMVNAAGQQMIDSSGASMTQAV